MIPFSNKLLKRVIRITDLHSMSLGPSWIHMIPFVEKNCVMFANLNKESNNESMKVYV